MDSHDRSWQSLDNPDELQLPWVEPTFAGQQCCSRTSSPQYTENPSALISELSCFGWWKYSMLALGGNMEFISLLLWLQVVFIIALIISTFFLRRSCLMPAEGWGLESFLRYATTASDWAAALRPCRPFAVDSPEGNNLGAWCQHARMSGCSLWQPPSCPPQLLAQPKAQQGSLGLHSGQLLAWAFHCPDYHAPANQKQKQRDEQKLQIFVDNPKPWLWWGYMWDWVWLSV